jgi:selenocysteine insertion sequence-binding protein 2
MLTVFGSSPNQVKFSGNSLDSSGPTKRRGKERERPRLKKPNKFKRLLIQNRKEQQELRQYLTKVSEARLKQQLLNAESFSQVSQDVKGDNTKEVDLKIEPLEDVKEVKGTLRICIPDV